MKIFIPLLVAFSISANPSFALGWGDCPHSKKGANQESSAEREVKTESSKEQ